MNALLIGGIFHAMPPPIIEHPGLASRHVYALIPAIKTHLRTRDDRYVHANTAKPVVVDVRMLWNGGAGRQLEQSRAAPNNAKTGQYLTQVSALFEMRCRQHCPVDVIVLAAVDADESYGAVPLDLIRVFGPSGCRKSLHFRL